jgi:hypothetical protein
VSLSRRGFLAASALTAAAPAAPAQAASQKRLNGADVLAAEGYKRLRGR